MLALLYVLPVIVLTFVQKFVVICIGKWKWESGQPYLPFSGIRSGILCSMSTAFACMTESF